MKHLCSDSCAVGPRSRALNDGVGGKSGEETADGKDNVFACHSLGERT